ncbi:MAG: PGDYG domain-containing protein [Burkholderiales bacterium]
MRQFQNVSLESDPLAARYVKDEVVTVLFAAEDGVIQSREGPNHYQRADALVTGSTGDKWSVIRARFEEKYEPVAPLVMGHDGAYHARRIPVWARQIEEPFAVARRAGGDLLCGNAGDWLLQYAPGDYGLVEGKRFKSVYRTWPE